MKKILRLLCEVLIFVLLLGSSEVSYAEDMAVYIPNSITKLGLPEMPEYISLKTRTESNRMIDHNGNEIYQKEKTKCQNTHH